MRREASLYRKEKNSDVECFLCSHNCKIKKGAYGICGVRQNIEGVLFTHVYGEVIASNIDPIEKKPLYHFLPGTDAYSIATVGCNFKCGFCQNWQISQSRKTDNASAGGSEMLPERVVEQARRAGCKSISYTYTEPTIFFEYALDTARIAKEQGLYNSFVTNGYMSREALDTIRPCLDAANIDLKFFKDETYRKVCKARLSPVLDSIKYMKELGIWIEVTTLVVPGLNDSKDELSQIAEFIAGVGNDIPWHISRFHPDYKYTDTEPTPMESLNMAQEAGKAAGLRYVYLGNVASDSDTFCYKCGKALIKRTYPFSAEVIATKCPICKTPLDGMFGK